MRWLVITACAGALAACGGGSAPPVDAKLTIIDGVILYPDTPVPDAVSATTGAIAITIQCGGPGCGKSGNLKVVVDDCMGGIPVASKTLIGKTLTSGSNVMTTADALAPAAYCSTAYLDVNTNFKQDTGDVVASAGATHSTVVAGQIADATITLDSLVP